MFLALIGVLVAEHQIAILKVIVASKIPLVGTKSLSKGYFEGLPNFAWSDVKDKDEIGKGSFGSVMKGNYIPSGKVVVVKRFFGEGDSQLRNIAKEAKMLKSSSNAGLIV